MCDRTPWGVELVKKVGSPRFKLLYDIYHMQIMEGDVIRTIQRQQGLHRPLPHRRQPGPARDRRDAGAELPGHREGDRRDRLRRLPRPGVHPQPRSAGVAGPRIPHLRCVNSTHERTRDAIDVDSGSVRR